MITIENKKILARQIEEIIKEAGQFILHHKIEKVMEKGNASNVVTNIDIQCQNLIIEKCKKVLPDSVFLAEEEGQQQISEQFTWVIDPIDATTNYVYDFHHSCVSIGLYYQRKGLIGVVYNPYLDECFVGIDGIGSFCNGKAIHVSQHPFHEALIMIGTSPYDKHLAEITFAIIKELFIEARDIRRSGSAALDLCYLACGRIDAFYEQNLQPWDYGAGKIIIENTGGKIKALVENAFDELKPTGVICSNGQCQERLAEIVLKYSR
ncbi:inositol monophosphatase family protein [Amedibacterium intestinale]|uniref:inositol monophosphatase family protein n=1 Tax=Amedibacterium intestinale TaxID=2583452 RepID=UPI0022E6D400|nr:inositol monophosphatase family protein [Amedibacterium intestinale]